MKQYTFHNYYNGGELVIDLWCKSEKSAVKSAQLLVLKFFYPLFTAKEAQAAMNYVPKTSDDFDFRPSAFAIQEACRDVYYHLNLVKVQNTKVSSHKVRYAEHHNQ